MFDLVGESCWPRGVCWKWLDGKCGLARPPVRSIVECAPQKKTVAVFEADRDRWCSCAESLSPLSEDQCPGRGGDKRGNHMPPRYRYWWRASAPIWLLLVLYGRRWRHLFPAKPGQAKPNHLLLTSIHPLHCATVQLDPLHYSKLQLLIRRRALITPSPGVPHIHHPTR